MNPLRDFPETFRPVIDGVHGRHVRQQRLRGADVTGGFFTADVLFTRLEREAQSGSAARILGNADNASGHAAFEFVARGKERSMRATVTQRHAEALRTTDGDVRAEFTGRLQ